MKKERILQTIAKDVKVVLAGIKKLPRFLGRHVFGFVLLLIFSDIIIGGIFYYKYVYVVNHSEPETVPSQVSFDKKKYQQILDYWKKREIIFNSTEKQNIKNPFSNK